MGMTSALVLAMALAGGPALPPRPAEPPRAHACREALVPEGRACVQRCEASLPGAAEAEPRFECTLACTQRTLRALQACREGRGQQARAPLASR